MKRLPIIMATLFLATFHSVLSQEVKQCKHVSELAFAGINERTAEKVKNHLADNFKIAGQTGVLAQKVLDQLFTQMEETVESFEEIKRIRDDNSLKLIYAVDFQKMGRKESAFTFNENNELTEMNLFKMEVKTLTQETKVQKSPHQVTQISFQMARNLIAVTVTLEGSERTFLLDSGSPRIVLNSIHLKDLNETSYSSTKGVTGESISGMNIESIRDLNFGGITINDQKVVTMDLSHLEKSLEMEIHGLISYKMIKDYDILFDYENQLLTLLDPSYSEAYLSQNFEGNRIKRTPIVMRGHIPTIKIKIGSNELTFGIDSGAEANLIEENYFQTMEEHLENITVDHLKGGDKDSKEVKSTFLEMNIDGVSFKAQNTVFTNIDHLNKKEELRISGLVGYPFLSNQKTLLSFIRKEIAFIE